MLKISIYIVTLLFLIIGFLYIFVIDINTADYVSNNIKINKSSNINDYLITNDFNLSNFTKKIILSCLQEDKACKVLEIYKYIASSFIINNTSDNSIINPMNAYKNKEGSYLDIAILYSSLLLHTGISTYIKKDNDRLYNYACGIENVEIYNAIKKDLRNSPLSEKYVTLRKNQVWAFDLSREEKDNLIIDIEFSSTYPIDMALFPNHSEMQAHLKGQYGRYNQDCSLFNKSQGTITCLAPQQTGVIMFKSLEDNNNLQAGIYKGGILVGDIKSEKSNQGSNCIKIDVNSKGSFKYPGII